MAEVIKSLKESKKARWIALIIVSLSMFGAYFFNYTLSPVKPMLESILGWNSTDFGIYTSSYTWFNVFLFMLIFSGIILDKLGVRITGFIATGLMALGTGINYWALIHVFPEGSAFLGIKTQVVISAIGFGIFGVGTEANGITVSKAVVKWFKGKEMALAMGMQMSIARLGTALALGISLPIAEKFNFATPVLVAFVFMLIGIVAFVIYSFMDKKLDASIKASGEDEDDKFQMKDILMIIKNKGFWYIAILCVLFYSAVFPFLFYATDLMINKYHVNPSLAGLIPALLPFGTIFLTPLFGTVYDKKGKGATIMIIGSMILIAVHGVLSIPFINFWLVAASMVVILGVGFALVPAAMWPSVPKIIPEKQLGTAYALIFWVQNIGLWAIPLLLGVILTSSNPDVSVNKTFIKNSLQDAYTQVLTDDYNFSVDEIRAIASDVNTKLIDSVVQVSDYEAVSVADLDTVALKNQIITNTISGLTNIDKTLDKKALSEKVVQLSVASIYSVIVDNKVNIRYNYQFDLLLFTLLSVLSLFIAILLKREDRIKGYGLEKPNIEEKAKE